MDFIQATLQFGVPLWVVPILEEAAKLREDKARRQKAYRLIWTKLLKAGLGLEKASSPTYVYPLELKQLIRSVFPEGVCDYPDPEHSKVVQVTLAELHSLDPPQENQTAV
ncbi:uncharacterized protein LOC106704104 [Latimeria chalumnae]|uniref:uncharacterized protein LOC106704104 n=1 Tax=Latimeria chalumnae TaxID=7897 RepID=UPI00313D6D70